MAPFSVASAILSPSLSLVYAVERASSRLDPAAWDAFAASAGATFRGSHQYLWTWRLRRAFGYRLRILEIYADEQGAKRKIGQCAVGVARRRGANVFLDGLNLAPEEEHRWPEAIQAVLAILGPGVFEYGWQLSTEPRREAVLATVDGVSILSARPLVVQAVDFSRWESWQAYFKAISENSRRSAKAAERDLPNLRMTVHTGISALRDIPAVARLRDSVGERKGLDYQGQSALRYAFGVITGGNRFTTAVASADGRPLSSYYGADFGERTYYLEGGSAPNNGGAAWSLLIDMLRRSYERHPRGKFVMGYIDYSIHQDDVGGGLLRARNACRVVEYETSVLRFRYDGDRPSA